MPAGWLFTDWNVARVWLFVLVWENHCTRPATLLGKIFIAGIFLWILQNLFEQFSRRTLPGDFFLYLVQYISFYSDFYNILLKVSSLKTYENTASDVLYFWHYYKLYLVGIRRFFCQMSYFGSVWTIAAFNSSMPVYTTIVRKLFFFYRKTVISESFFVMHTLLSNNWIEKLIT